MTIWHPGKAKSFLLIGNSHFLKVCNYTQAQRKISTWNIYSIDHTIHFKRILEGTRSFSETFSVPKLISRPPKMDPLQKNSWRNTELFGDFFWATVDQEVTQNGPLQKNSWRNTELFRDFFWAKVDQKVTQNGSKCNTRLSCIKYNFSVLSNHDKHRDLTVTSKTLLFHIKNIIRIRLFLVSS